MQDGVAAFSSNISIDFRKVVSLQTMSRLKIGFAGRWDPRDKKSWSGTYYYSYQQLQAFADVEIIHLPYPKWLREYLITFYKNPQKWFYQRKTAVEFLKPYAKYFSKQLEKELIKRKLDLLYMPAAPQLLAYTDLKLPVIFMTDATFQQIQGYYDTWQNFSPFNIRQGIELDQLAFQKATHCMLASNWCKQSAINDYGLKEEKISVVPLGANLDTIPAKEELTVDGKSCRLLFLGVEWERKGGAIALETFYQLKQKGMHATLHIIGCVPPVEVNDAAITVIPYLNKNNPEEFQQLHQILLQTDYLLLPTRAEAAGVVFCEASAYGIPSITTNTGGVATYVRDGINGFALSADAGAEAYTDIIATLHNDVAAYTSLCFSSREFFDQELNWNAWGKQFQQIATSL
ncbi:MAG: glycosyltransferase family 4 protein [Chitinophagaceae bacterium]|jgi:glycosyltransferase involved in cell wall biosynthesis|nr:glycosyltransferase family 4 protein [Chitinophagaceae bacterium]